MIDAGELVRTAREGLRLSARDLAARSGLSPSTVTRIERGEVNPTVATLERILRAAGNELVVTVRPLKHRPTLAALRTRRAEIIRIVESMGGTNVRVFGSVARGEARPDSDVDLLIDVPPGTGLIVVEQIADGLNAALPWRVDVMTSGAARRRMSHVLDEAVPL